MTSELQKVHAGNTMSEVDLVADLAKRSGPSPFAEDGDWTRIYSLCKKGCTTMVAFDPEKMDPEGSSDAGFEPVFFNGVGIAQHAREGEAAMSGAALVAGRDSHTAVWVENRMYAEHQTMGRIQVEFVAKPGDATRPSQATLTGVEGDLLDGEMRNELYLRLTLLDYGITAINNEPLVLTGQPSMISASSIASDERVLNDAEGLPSMERRVLSGVEIDPPFRLAGLNVMADDDLLALYNEADPTQLVAYVKGAEVRSSHNYGLDFDLVGSEQRESSLWALVRVRNLTSAEQQVNIWGSGHGRLDAVHLNIASPVTLAGRGEPGSHLTFEFEVAIPDGMSLSEFTPLDSVTLAGSNVADEFADQLCGGLTVGVTKG